MSTTNFTNLANDIREWGQQLGFQQVGITGIELGKDETHLLAWLKKEHHGDMDYMRRHGTLRTRPEELVPGTCRIISLRMDYWPEEVKDAWATLGRPEHAYISRYASGRDYHKVIRTRLQRLADKIKEEVGEFGYRAFTDSAPVLEKALARDAGLGWIGKHTNLINEKAGSWFFLGEIYTDLPLPTDTSATNHCGTCNACIDACPTNAIVAPYQLDARLCISYLTIEHHGSIPENLRPLMGNRIYGCDDCQLVCPWNRFAKASQEPDYQVRHGLDSATLAELFCWNEEDFLRFTEGSAIRRIGYQRWLRNIAVALGNAPPTEAVTKALEMRQHDPSELVREHVAWALAQST